MKKYIAFGAIAIVLIAGVVHLSRTTSPPPDPRLIRADNDFAFRLYKEVAKRDAGKNIFISPISIALALQMTYNGASGTTKEGMAKALGIQGMSLEEVNKDNSALLSNLANAGPKVNLDIANSLWVKKEIELDKGFVRRCTESYHAEVATLDFGSLLTPTRINSWAARKTHGKIRKVVGCLDPDDDALLLINAVYFKGIWAAKFDKANTRQDHFFITERMVVDVPMMSQVGKFDTLSRTTRMSGSNFSAVRLPYGEGKMSMYIFLPDRGCNLGGLFDQLDAASWDEWMAGFKRGKILLRMPRFKTEYEAELNETLKALGMGEALDPNHADFRDMGIRVRGPVWLHKTMHKTFVEVDEEGTRAAAVTVFTMRARGGGPPRFVVDRPFFFVIRDDKTGVILFMGSVVDPTKN